MTSSRLVRGAKTRMIASVCLIFVLGALVYVFHGTQARLAEVQKIANSCTQQTESLSAQFQVLFEYKLRLEKSLQTEKRDHKKAIDDAEKKIKEEKEDREREREESNKKYDAKVQEYMMLKAKVDDSKILFEKQISDLTAEKTKLVQSLETIKTENAKLLSEKDSLKTKLDDLQAENEKLKKDLKTKDLPSDERLTEMEKQRDSLRKELLDAKKLLSTCQGTTANQAPIIPPLEENKHALEAPQEGGGESGAKGSSSTTPGINPQAVYTADSSSLKTPTKERVIDDKAMFLKLKKSTPESGVAKPLALPEAGGMGGNDAGVGPGGAGLGQIPIPPDDGDQLLKSNKQDDNEMERQIAENWEENKREMNNNAAIEDVNDFPIQNEEPKIEKSKVNYQDRDYKDDQGDEEDDEVERIGEYGNQMNLHRESQMGHFSNMDSPNEETVHQKSVAHK